MANNGLKVRLLYLCVGMLLGSVSLVLAQTKRMETEGDLGVDGNLEVGGDVAVAGDQDIDGGLDVGTYSFLAVNNSNGHVGLGTTTPFDTLTIEDNRGTIAIEEISSSPPAHNEGFAKFFVDIGEMFVLDENDNDTQLSSHADPRNYGAPTTTSFDNPNVDLPFSFHHKNRIIGIGAVVDLAAAISDLETLTGKDYTTVYNLPGSTSEELLDRYDWIEIPIEEAFEQVELMVPETETVFEYDPDTLQLSQVEVPTGEPSEVGSGAYRTELKDNVRFDKSNGKFYRRPTVAEIPQGATPTCPNGSPTASRRSNNRFL